MLAAWLVTSHTIAAAGVLALPLGGAERVLALAALAAHAWWRRPTRVGRLIAAQDGIWALPDRGLTGLRLSARTRYGSWWAELRLCAPDRSVAVLLCRDQLAAEDWRRLKARLLSESVRPLVIMREGRRIGRTDTALQALLEWARTRLH